MSGDPRRYLDFYFSPRDWLLVTFFLVCYNWSIRPVPVTVHNIHIHGSITCTSCKSALVSPQHITSLHKPLVGVFQRGESEYNSPCGMEWQTFSKSLPNWLLLLYLGHPVRGISKLLVNMIRIIVTFYSCILYTLVQKKV